MTFSLFARPGATCRVSLFAADGERRLGSHEMREGVAGYFAAEVAGLEVGALYKFVVDDRELPDPYARFLPHGVHGPAAVTASEYVWRHGPGVARPLGQHVIYELHVGAFSEAGTYEGVRRRLPELAALGITAIELMPIAAFAGAHGWGYDGVALYAPHAPYGQPDELRALVDDAHGLGLSVFLDVVYNHFGPSGNYLRAYSEDYFTRDVRNAWGDAPNYAHPAMRQLVLGSALHWLTAYRFDGLRLDATHAILDPSPRPILRELADAVGRLQPGKLLMAEDERNQYELVRELGMDAIWADDFHHELHVNLTAERDGYYAAYTPSVDALARTINQGWLYQGDLYAPTGKPRGTAAAALEAPAFIYCLQNHDQIGNRALGDRLTASISLDRYKAASTLLLFLPMTPLLFMGQEWAASSPFLYFSDHDAELGRLISEGRRNEFKQFTAFSDPAVRAAIPDPQEATTFQGSRLRWDERAEGEHAEVLALYQRLLELRRTDPVLQTPTRRGLLAQAAGDVLVVTRTVAEQARVLLVNFGAAPVGGDLLPLPGGVQTLMFRSDGRGDWDGALPAHTAVILRTTA